MIIFYGVKSSHVKSEYSDDGVCPACDTPGQMVMGVNANYAHVFWIPFFPLYKKVLAICNHCNAVFELKEMPQDLRNQCDKFRRAQRFPVWHFAGLIAVCALILFAVVGDANTARLQNAYLANPKVNDVYVTKYEGNSFSSMKIVEITSDSIYFADNAFYANRGEKLETIDEDESYDHENLLSFAIEEIKDLKKEGLILRIKRK